MFIKNDNEFDCVNCGKHVNKLGYTSRDHCNYCLHSIHVDIGPGDRLNECRGELMPVNVHETKKGKQIVYKCSKCKKEVRNIVAEDDNAEEIYKVIEKHAKDGGR